MSGSDDAARARGDSRGYEVAKRYPSAFWISDPNAGMRRAAVYAMLVAFILFARILQAQHMTGRSQGRAGASRQELGVHSGLHQKHSRGHNSRNYGSLYPVWYEWNEEEQTASPAVSTQPGKSKPLPQGILAAGPKMIELPGPANSGVSSALRPAIFILTNGDRFETRRYLLTHDNLFATIGRQQRAIPLAMLDINATIAADHERRIDLRIPADRGEILLGF